jgi:hypothetical protein
MKELTFTVAVDYYDLIWCSEKLFQEEEIDRFLGQCAEHGVTTVQWRLSACGKLLYHSRTPDRYGSESSPADFHASFAAVHQRTYEKCCTIMEKIDPLEVAIRLARKHGLKLHPWLTLFDEHGYGMMTSSLVDEHPEFCWKAKTGNEHYLGVVSYVYPEVQEFRMRQIDEILAYGADGLYLCNRSHSRPPEFYRGIEKFMAENPGKPYSTWIQDNRQYVENIQTAAREQYGFDPPALAAFREQFSCEPDKNPSAWWHFRGSYFTAFLARAATKARQAGQQLGFGLRYSPENPCFVYGNRFFNWQTLCDDGIVDELHYVFPESAEPDYRELFPETATSAVKRFGWVWMGAKDLEKTIQEKVTSLVAPLSRGSLDGITLFEACHFYQNPALWKIINHIKTGVLKDSC